MFIENLIGSKAKVKILRVLSELRTAYPLAVLKAETGLSLSIVHKACEELVEEKVLEKIKGKRKERLYKFNPDGLFAGPLFEIFKTEKTRHRKEVVMLKIWSILEMLLAKIKNKVLLMVLFGSQATGRATLDSDIDVLIIPKKQEFIHDIASGMEEVVGIGDKIKTINKFSPTFLDLETFKSDMKNNTLFYRNLKSDGILLYVDDDIKEEINAFLNEITPKTLRLFTPSEMEVMEKYEKMDKTAR